MNFLVCIGALVLLMFVAYRGFSVILFAPIAALLAVLLTDPAAVPGMPLAFATRIRSACADCRPAAVVTEAAPNS